MNQSIERVTRATHPFTTQRSREYLKFKTAAVRRICASKQQTVTYFKPPASAALTQSVSVSLGKTCNRKTDPSGDGTSLHGSSHHLVLKV